MKKINDSLVIGLFYTLTVSLVALCAFYIVHNAAWLIGDDAIVIRHTGFGKPFLPADNIWRESGRFFPFTYLMYNLLLPFFEGFISPAAHYCLHAFFFVLCVANYAYLLLEILRNKSVVFRYTITFLFVVVLIGRTLPNFLECFSTVWFGYFLKSLFLLCAYFLHVKQKAVYLIIAIIIENFAIYRGETAFVTPLAMGTCAMLFQRASLTKKEKCFHLLLIISALSFLAIYAFSVLPYVEQAYDGAHGQDVSIWENAFNILLAQKILLLAIPFFIYRVFLVVSRKSPYTFFDNLLLTAAAVCCGGFLLRLNWTLYYNSAALFSLVAIIYYLSTLWNEKKTFILVFALALFYSRKIPSSINDNQQKRIEQPSMIANVLKVIDDQTMVWYDPYVSESQHDISRLKKNWLSTYFAWTMMNTDYKMESVKDISTRSSEIVFMANEDEGSFLSSQPLSELIFNCGGICGYRRNVK